MFVLSNKKRILSIIAYSVVIIFFVLLFKNVNIHELKYHVTSLNVSVLCLIIGLQLFTQFLLVFQWYSISKVVIIKTTFLKILRIFTLGSVIEAITPGAKIGGEVTRLYYMKKDLHCNSDEAMSVILMQKSISMSVLLTICVASLIYISSLLSTHVSIFLQILLASFSIGLIILMLSFLLFSNHICKVLENREYKMIQRLHKFVATYANIRNLLTKKMWLLQFVISTIVWILFPLKMVILTSYLGVELSFIIVIAITMSAYMVGMFPITPGGIGTFEGVMITLFTLLSIETSIAITISVIFRFITFWFVVIVSALCVLIFHIIEYCKGGLYENK